MSNRSDFLDIREQESFINPLPYDEAVETEKEPTRAVDYLSDYSHDDLYCNSQYYHARPRTEGESVLLNGGEYVLFNPDESNEFVMFQLEKYDPFQPSKFILTVRKLVYGNNISISEGDYTQVIEVSTLRGIRPMTREEDYSWLNAKRIERQVFNKDGSKAYICSNVSRKDRRTGKFNYYGKRFVTE